MMMTLNNMDFAGSLQPQSSNSFEDETENLYFSNNLLDDQEGSTSVPGKVHLDHFGSKMELDPDYGVVVNPAEITGQSLAVKMEYDKATFDLEKFVNEQAMQIQAPPVEETQDLIQEMEEFLSQYEDNNVSHIGDPDFDNLADQLLSMEQQETLNSMDTSCPITNGDLSADQISAAEDLVDELLKSENELPTSGNDSGFEESFNVSNVSQFQTDEGNIIIVIAPEANHSQSDVNINNDTISEIDVSTQDSDSDWVPEEVYRKKPGRKPSSREPLTSLSSSKKKSYKTIKDKKERKKVQNVMAARRYRDKKKLEAQEAENEEQTLLRKNRELKDQLKDIENEMKTMKKLMVELGLFKVVKK